MKVGHYLVRIRREIDEMEEGKREKTFQNIKEKFAFIFRAYWRVCGDCGVDAAAAAA